MKLKNNGDAFKITFDSTNYDVPEGEFEVTKQDLGQFIVNKSIQWKKDVTVLEYDAPAEIKPVIEPIAIQSTEAPEAPEVAEEPVEDSPVETDQTESTPEVVEKVTEPETKE